MKTYNCKKCDYSRTVQSHVPIYRCPDCKEPLDRSCVTFLPESDQSTTPMPKTKPPKNQKDDKIKNLIAALADLGADVESRMLGVQDGDKVVHMSITHTLNGMGEMLAAKDERIAQLEKALKS